MSSIFLKVKSSKLHGHLISYLGGFTLIELLVVIAIITVISLIGITLFTNVSSTAADTKRKGDIASIAKAYEANFANGVYPVLQDGYFASGKIPTPVDTNLQGDTNYFNSRNADGSGFRVCATLAGGTAMCSASSSTCFCKDSNLGTYIASVPPAPPPPGGPTPPPPPGGPPPQPPNPPVAQVAFRASAANTVAAAAGSSAPYTSTITKPASIQAGDVMIVQVINFNLNPTITAPSGWNIIGTRQTSGPNLATALYSKTATASEPGSYTWSFSSAATTGLTLVAYYNAAPLTFPTANFKPSATQTNQVTTDGVTTVASNEMLIFFGVIAAGSTTLGVPTGMTQRVGGASSVIVSADQLIGVAGPTGPRVANTSPLTNGYNIGALVAIRPLEAVNESSMASCGSNCVDHFLDIDCKGIPTRHAQVRETWHSGTRQGTIVYSTGLYGNSLYSTTLAPTSPFPWTETPNNNPQITVANMNSAGYKGYEIYWTDAPNGAYPPNPNGWGTNASGYGFKNAMCGYASILNWIYGRENSSSNVLCTQGNSAGGSQIAYGLSYYNLASKIDMAIISGGPPFSNLDKSCESNSPYTDGSTSPYSSPNNTGRDTFTDYMLGWQDTGEHYCRDIFSAGTSALVRLTAQADSIYNTVVPGTYTYPNTKINFIQTAVGSDDLVQYQGNYYMSAVNISNGLKTNYTTSGYPSGYGHLVDQYNDGVTRIRNLLTTECHAWP